MSYILKKIIMYNFKLFPYKEISFEGMDITVFDGPNGYGKTSTFDAIEYALTGNIERISQCQEIDGKTGYENNCIVYSASEYEATEARVEAVFSPKDMESDLQELKVVRKISNLDGKANNPQKIKENTVSIIAVGNEEPQEYAEVDEANLHIAEFLGENVWKYFTRYFYISQEDRLKFLNKTEAARMSSLSDLFNTSNAEAEKKKCAVIKTQLEALRKKIESSCKQLEMEGKEKEVKSNLLENPVPYIHLLPQTLRLCTWDVENPQIMDAKQLNFLTKEMRGIESFFNNFSEFQKASKNKKIKDIAENEDAVLHYLLLLNYNGNVEEFVKRYKKYIVIQKVCQDAQLNSDSPLYEKLDYEKISKEFQINYDKDGVERDKSEIKNCRERMGRLEKAKGELIDLRGKIVSKRKNLLENNAYELSDQVCPLCGYPWSDENTLLENIKKIDELLENGNSNEQIIIAERIAHLEAIYESSFQKIIKQYFETNAFMQEDICNSIYKKCGQGVNVFLMLNKYIVQYNIMAKSYQLPLENVSLWKEIAGQFVNEQLLSQVIEVSAEYPELEQKYNFASVYTEYFGSDSVVEECMKGVSKPKFDEKVQYLEQCFYSQQAEKKAELERQSSKLKERLERLKNILDNIKRLENIYKNEINEYRSDIVCKIRIPFYLYSGRILQNYTGGLGVVLEVINDKAIRFKALERPEHDVMYTFSSGQLSAVVLALTLTLSKIYAKDKFRCVLIDDPIQTMDDLNIASFVELLRTDFSEYQLIISTHETDFSDYIRYKFGKYGHKHQSIDMSIVE